MSSVSCVVASPLSLGNEKSDLVKSCNDYSALSSAGNSSNNTIYYYFVFLFPLYTTHACLVVKNGFSRDEEPNEILMTFEIKKNLCKQRFFVKIITRREKIYANSVLNELCL